MLIGDQRLLSLQVRSSSAIEPDSISFSAWKKLGVETLTRQAWSRDATGNFQQQLRIVAFDTGYIKLPPLALPYRNGQQIDSVYSNDLAIEVGSIMIDSTGLAPIKPIIREPFAFRDLVPYLIAFGVGLLLIGLLFLRKKKEIPPEVIVEVPIPADELALKDLERLRSKKLWQQGQIKAYQSDLTHIIRAYIEGRFEMPALESTTSEILEAPSIKSLGQDLVADLSQILNMADLIKFAKAQPEVGIHEEFMLKAEQFVRSTRAENRISEEHV
jgi:hypothetical protein